MKLDDLLSAAMRRPRAADSIEKLAELVLEAGDGEPLVLAPDGTVGRVQHATISESLDLISAIKAERNLVEVLAELDLSLVRTVEA